MEQRTITLKTVPLSKIINLIEEQLHKIPRPVHISEKPGKSVTQYFFWDPIRWDSTEEPLGRITINYYKNTSTQYAIMAGLVLEKGPMIFECYQDDQNNAVVVKGYCSTNHESRDWIKPIFDDVFQSLIDCFLTD
jgi:hypothetical protein